MPKIPVLSTRFLNSTIVTTQKFFKDNVNFCSTFCFANERAKKLKKLMDISQQNLLYTQKLKNKIYNKNIKP